MKPITINASVFKAIGEKDKTGQMIRQGLENPDSIKDDKVRRLVDVIRERRSIDFKEICREWNQEYGRPYPTSIDDWLRLAAEVGIPAERLLDLDEVRPSEIRPVIEGCLLKFKRDDAATEDGSEPVATVDDVAQEVIDEESLTEEQLVQKIRQALVNNDDVLDMFELLYRQANHRCSWPEACEEFWRMDTDERDIWTTKVRDAIKGRHTDFNRIMRENGWLSTKIRSEMSIEKELGMLFLTL